MMTARAKRVLSYTEELQKANNAFITDNTDAFFDLIDGIYEKQGTATSNAIKLAAGITQVNLEYASKVYDILTGSNGK